MKGFKGAKVYIKGRGIVRTDISLFNGRIAGIGCLPDIQPITNTGECLLVPGFIDEHIHGAGGADVMDGTLDALSVISGALIKEGTTSFLATTMTQSDANIKNSLKAAAEYCGNGARLLGMHLEGPFISLKHIGAQPAEYVRSPSVEYFKELQDAADNKIKIVTLAPEEDGGSALIGYLAERGIVVSVGHSNASQEHISEAIERGLSCVTHTFNAQSPLHHREIGVAGSALLYDSLCCEVIADTVHVSVSALKLVIKNKPKDKIVLITDSMRAKGLKDGVSELGGQTVFVKDGQARLADGTLAGSILKMNQAVKNIVEKCGVPIETALDYATFNPAKNLGIEKEYGVVKEGAFADFTLLDDKFNVMLTVVGGKIVYEYK